MSLWAAGVAEETAGFFILPFLQDYTSKVFFDCEAVLKCDVCLQ